MATTTITDSSFEEDVLKSNKPVLIDYWAEWCGPCKQIGPALEEISEEMKEQIIIGKINIDENPQTPSKYGVKGIPTLMIFNNGDSDLNINSMNTDNGQFTLSSNSGDVGPGDTLLLTVSLSPQNLGIITGNLNIYNNDIIYKDMAQLIKHVHKLTKEVEYLRSRLL